MHANAILALRRGSRIGAAACRQRVGPWLLLDADSELDFLNVAVLLERVRTAASAVLQASDWFYARGRSFCFLLRDRVDAAVIAELEGDGRYIAHRLPALLLRPLRARAVAPGDLSIETVNSIEALRQYGDIGGDEQGLDRVLMHAIAKTAHRSPGFTLLLGRLHGRPIATSLALVTGELVGIYNVNVVSGCRGQGVGTAMTEAAIDIGRQRGCHAAFLESTPDSHRLYVRMGFVEQYSYVQIAG